MAQASSGQTAQQNPIAVNAQMRQALLSTAPRMRKNLGTFGPFNLGDNLRQKLFNVGVGTSLDLVVSATVTLGGTSPVYTPSPRAPFNLIDNVQLQDYDGTARVNCSGYQLFLNRTMLSPQNGLAGYANSQEGRDPTYNLPGVPTNASGTMQFNLNVPMAYNPESDLRGAMLMQTATGEAYINLTFNGTAFAAANADAVYNAAAGTSPTIAISDIYVTVFQNYLSPLAIGNQVPLPSIDLSTVYELNGSLKSSDSIAVGVQKLLNYPNVRTVLATYLEYVNNGVMAAGNLQGIQMLANGNTTIQEWGEIDLADYTRRNIGCDLPPGTFYITSRSAPIQTVQYGNVQLGFTPSAAANGNTYVGVMYESFYAKGSSLPGMTQG